MKFESPCGRLGLSVRSAVLLMACVALFLPSTLSAQQVGVIQGRVVGPELEALVNAQVSIPSLNRGALTDAQGRFQIINVPVGELDVRVDLLGYRSQNLTVNVAAGEVVTLEFEMNTLAIALGELVVTATGEQRKVEIGNAVSSVDVTDLSEKSLATSVPALLQGNAPGVTITSSSSTIGNAMNIKVRGNSSINLSNMPLVYVDGARVSTDARSIRAGGAESDRMLDFSPDEIQSIEIVKGPAAATLYGTEAAAGVIRITTKRGAAGQGRTTARMNFGVSWDPHDYPVRGWNPSMALGPSYADTTYLIDNLKGSAPVPDESLYYNPFRTGQKKGINVAWQGGTDLFNYYTLMDVSDEGGVFPTNGQRAYRLRGNFSFQASENLNINLSNGFLSNHTDFNYNDGESWGYVGAVLLGKPEYAPIVKDGVVTCPLGYETHRTTGQSLQQATSAMCDPDRTFIGSNNFARLRTMDVEQDTDRYTGTLALRWTPKPWSSSRLSIGYDSYSERFFNMIPNDPLKVRDSAPQRYLRDVNGKTLTLDGTTAVTFDLNPDWRSQTTFGVQFYRELVEESWGNGVNFPPGAETVGNGATRDAGESFTEVRTLGLFVQQQFSFADRLFLTPAVRFDDNSAFGSNLGSIVYPRMSASYVISEEGWFPELQMVDQLRLRGAYGTSGKQPGPFDAVTLLSVSSVTLPDGSSAIGFQPTRRGNSDLKPETGSEIELGFDTSLWDGRFGVEFTYFNQTTKDALILKPVPPSSGFTAGVWDNVGEVKNSGVEVALDATLLQRSSLLWSTRLTYSHLTSEITELAAPIAIGGRGLQEHREGYPFGAYFMYPVTLQGDQVVVADEREFVGQPTPSYTGALSSTLSLFDGRVRFYGLLEYMGGHKTVNYTETYQCRTAFGTCKARFEKDANGNLTDMARLKGDPAANFQSYHFTYKADFAKLRQLSVNITIPSAWTGYLGADSGDFGIVASNLFTITDYPGTDPEINSQGRENASQREFFSAGVPSALSFRLSLVY